MVAGPKYTKVWLSDKTTDTSIMSVEHNTTVPHLYANHLSIIDGLNLLLPTSEIFSTQNDPPTINRFYGNDFVPLSQNQQSLVSAAGMPVPRLHTMYSTLILSPLVDYSTPYNANNIVEYIFVQSAAGVYQYNVSGLVLNQAQVTSNVIGYGIGK